MLPTRCGSAATIYSTPIARVSKDEVRIGHLVVVEKIREHGLEF
jgi:hypothetical protein